MFSISMNFFEEISFYISGYLIQLIIKNYQFGRKNPNLANLSHFFLEKSFTFVK
jgi:hypothetical protein